MTLNTASKCMFSFLPGVMDNTYAATYTVTLHAYDLYANASQHRTTSFNLNLVANQDVTYLTSPNNLVVTARRFNNKTLPDPLFNNDAGEALTYSFTTSPPTSRIYFNWTAMRVIVDRPVNSDANVYTVTITGSDGVADTADATTSFLVTINKNPPPTVNDLLVDMTFVEDRSNSDTIPSTPFVDNFTETITMTHSFSPPAPFLSFDNTTGVISGTPTLGDVGPYTFTLTATDPWPDTGSTSQNMVITVQQSLPPVSSQTFSDASVIGFKYIAIDYDETLVTDPNGDGINFAMYHNLTGSWYTQSSPAMLLYGTPDNTHVGNYTITFRVYDNFSKETNYSINLEIIENQTPTRINSTLYFDIWEYQPFNTNCNAFFTEPEGETITWDLTDVAANLSWVSVSNSTNLMTGIPPQLSASSYNNSLKLVAIDENGLNTSTVTHINVKRNHAPYLTGYPSTFDCYEGVQ